MQRLLLLLLLSPAAFFSGCIVLPPAAAPHPHPPPPVQVIEAPAEVYIPPPPPPPPPEPAYTRREAEAIVTRAYLDVLDRRPDPDGLRHYRQRLMDRGWTERQVIQDLQRSDEARAINPDQAIAKLYREVLRREPDPHGLAHYRQKWREGWTRNAIREDLRQSKEGRDVAIRTMITQAYRDILGREPDPGGYAAYEKLLRENRMTERQLRESLRDSEEGRARNDDADEGGKGGRNRGRRR